MGEQEKHSSEKIKARESKTYLTELDEIPMPREVCDRAHKNVQPSSC